MRHYLRKNPSSNADDAIIRQCGLDPNEFPRVRRKAIADQLRKDYGEQKSESPAEDKLVIALKQNNINFQQQVWIKLSKTRKIRVDFLIDSNIIVEVDGYAYHSNSDVWHSDRLRDNALLIMGYKVLRYPARNVFKNVRPIINDIKKVIEIESLNFFSLDK